MLSPVRLRFQIAGCLPLLSFVALTGCSLDSMKQNEPPTEPPQIALRANGWLRGDLHVHTAWSHDSQVSTIETVRLAEYLENETFLAANPHYENCGLDFTAVTDHRVADILIDPDFVSDWLILIPGEEFGGNGHASCLGISEFVDHDPGGDGVTVDDIEAAIIATHDQGAVFSVNHPFYPKNPWPWDVRDIDAIEVWNNGWAAGSWATTEAVVQQWEGANGPSGPFFRYGAKLQGKLSSDQSLAYYEALLSRGILTGLVGGSDRHMLVLPGFPTTYIKTDSADVAGAIQGLRAQHTFVSRTPASVQLIGGVELNGDEYMFGDAVSLPPTGAEILLTVRVSRANGGRLLVRRGSSVATDLELETGTLGSVLVDEEIDSDNWAYEASMTVKPGDWLYAIVHERLVPEDLSAENAELVRETADAIVSSGSSVTSLFTALVDLVDLDALTDIDKCYPDEWQPNRTQCLAPDAQLPSAVFIPDMLDRALNVIVEDGVATDYCMGAVASAVLFVPAR